MASESLSTELTARRPPDDAGSDTFARYKYQAKVTFPYLLACATGGDVVAVIPEHFEDLTLEYEGRWRFIQVKSRDGAQGAWPLRALLGEGGALTSLFRAFEATADLNATYELHLEQPVSARALTALLRTEAGRTDASLIAEVAASLGVKKKVAKEFLARVRLAEPLPPREHIDAVNVWLLMSVSPGLRFDAARAVYQKALACIESAMAGEKPAKPWPKYTQEFTPGLNSGQQKRLTRDDCKSTLGALAAGPSRLLCRALDPNLPRPTDLEMKLLAAGVPPGLIDDAMRLRAQAVASEVEFLNIAEGSRPAAFEGGDARLTDVQQRLLARLKALTCAHAGLEAPGPKVWNEFMETCHRHADQLDPHGVFGRDPMLLVGEACELSDQCLSGWGARDA